MACSVNETDVQLGEKVAQGSEGEVWKGHLRQHGSKPMPLFLYCDPLSQVWLLLNWQQGWVLPGLKATLSGEKQKFQVALSQSESGTVSSIVSLLLCV